MNDYDINISIIPVFSLGFHKMKNYLSVSRESNTFLSFLRLRCFFTFDLRSEVNFYILKNVVKFISSPLNQGIRLKSLLYFTCHVDVQERWRCNLASLEAISG
jgi:hypothetical protein